MYRYRGMARNAGDRDVGGRGPSDSDADADDIPFSLVNDTEPGIRTAVADARADSDVELALGLESGAEEARAQKRRMEALRACGLLARSKVYGRAAEEEAGNGYGESYLTRQPKVCTTFWWRCLN